MAATTEESKDERPLPRGAARIPLWWMEITPHNVLDLEEDERKRDEEEKEARMFAELAMQDDNAQRDHQDASASPSSVTARQGRGGYTRGTSQWKSAVDAAVDGRQFKAGHTPRGYQPGQYGQQNAKTGPEYQTKKLRSRPGGIHASSSGGAAADGPGQSGLSTPQYGDKDMTWSKPSWTKIKLRSTSTGSAIRKGKYSDKTFRGNGDVNNSIQEDSAAAEDKPQPKTPSPTKEAPADDKPSVATAPTVAVAAGADDNDDDPKPAEDTKDTNADDVEDADNNKDDTNNENNKDDSIGRFVKRVRRRKVEKRKPNKSDSSGDDASVDTDTEAPTSPPPQDKPKLEDQLSPNRLKSRPPPPPAPANNDNEPAWVKMRREREQRAAAPEYEEEYYTDEEEIDDDDEEEYVEEIIIEDEDGNEIVAGNGGMDVSTHDVTDLQTALAKKANELKLLEEQLKMAPA